MHDYDNEEKLQSDWCQSVQNGRTTPLHSSYLEVRGQFKTIRLEVSTFLGEGTFGSAYKGYMYAGINRARLKFSSPIESP